LADNGRHPGWVQGSSKAPLRPLKSDPFQNEFRRTPVGTQ